MKFVGPRVRGDRSLVLDAEVESPLIIGTEESVSLFHSNRILVPSAAAAARSGLHRSENLHARIRQVSDLCVLVHAVQLGSLRRELFVDIFDWPVTK